MHSLSVDLDYEDGPPTVDGWAQPKLTGLVAVMCTCGLDTGLVPRAEGLDVAREHIEAWPAVQ